MLFSFWKLVLPVKSVMESIANFSFRYISIFRSLPDADRKTLSTSKMELFITIANYYQPLTIATKISAEFLDPLMNVKDDC